MRLEDKRDLAQTMLAQLITAFVRQAIAQGYSDLASLEADPDLDPLRSYPEYTVLLDELRGSAPPP